MLTARILIIFVLITASEFRHLDICNNNVYPQDQIKFAYVTSTIIIK